MVRYGALEPGERIEGPEGCGYAVATGSRSGVFVVDFDDLSSPILANEWPATYSVQTSRGLHLYYRCPDFTVRNSVGKLAIGIDVRGEGGIAVAPGTRHASGKTYTVVDAREPVDAPAWLLAWVGLSEAPADVYASEASDGAPVPVDVTTHEGQRRVRLAREYLPKAEPSIEGHDGSGKLWNVAIRLVRRFELPLSVVAELVEELFNPRCVPPWSSAEIWHKLEEVRDKSPIPCGIGPEGWNPFERMEGDAPAATPTNTAEAPSAPAVHDYTHIPGHNAPAHERRKYGITEAVAALRIHPAWDGVLRYDLFRRRAVAVNPPLRMDLETIGLSAADVTGVRTWYETVGAVVGKEDTIAAIESACRTRPFHPVKDYLDSLPVPTTKHLNSLGQVLFGTSDPLKNEYVRKWLIAAVARIYCPGCKVDTVLVLCGIKGGEKKSTAFEILFKNYYRSDLPDISNARSIGMALRGNWCVELGELAFRKGKDDDSVKEFLQRRKDKFDPKYAPGEIEVPRENVFGATCNDIRILNADSAMRRRWWPIEVTQKLPVTWLEAHVDEIWSEARAAFLAGEKWYFEDEAVADAGRLEHIDLDPWMDAIRDYCAGREYVRSCEAVWIEKIAKGDAGSLAKLDKRTRDRIGNVLRLLGLERWVKKVDGQALRVFRVPDELRALPPSAEERARRGNEEAQERIRELSKN